MVVVCCVGGVLPARIFFMFCRKTVYRFISWLKWIYWKAEAIVRYVFTGDCGMFCGYTKTYGFVPECGCPIHDRT